MSNDNPNKDVASSLAAMNADLTSPTPATPNAALHEMSNAEQPVAAPPVVLNTQQQLALFEEINTLMGQFLVSLKSLDKQFSKAADEFFSAAGRIANKSRNTRDDNIEIALNVAIGGTIKGIGKIWGAWKTSKHLSEVKTILAGEAAAKLSHIQDIKRMMPGIIDAAYARYNQESNPAQSLTVLNNLRDTEYMNSVVLFLEETYTAALNRQFQDVYPFPSYAPINRHILYGILCNSPELGYSGTIQSRRKCIDSLITSVDNAIKKDTTGDKETYIFASDSQVMATAIYDTYPIDNNKDMSKWLETIEETEDEGIKLTSEKYYSPFSKLYMVAREYPNSPLSQKLKNNKSFVNTVGSVLDIAVTNKEVEQSETTFAIVIILSVILGFLGAWILYDIAWYWSIAIGIGVGIVMRLLLPYSSLDDKHHDKLYLIEKNIQTTNQKEMGEIKKINLSKLDDQNTSVWGFIIIGGIIGAFFGGVGAIPGAIIGGIIGLFVGNDDEEEGDYSYDHIKVTTSKKIWCLLVLEIAALLYILYRIIFT